MENPPQIILKFMIIEKHSLNVYMYFEIMIVMKTFFFIFYKWTVYNAKSIPATNAYSNSMHFADAFINVTYNCIQGL